MGVPYYFSVIARKHANYNIITQGTTVSTSPSTPSPNTNTNTSSTSTIDALFLDYNSIIHNTIREVLDEHKGEGKSVANNELFEAIWLSTTLVVQNVDPTNAYIMIDGIAPRAKMVQQRKRRYLQTLQTLQVTSNDNTWDTNQVSPCTPFMVGLEQYLATKIEDHNRGSTKTITYHLSSSAQKGEGEHKMFAIINNPDKPNKNVYIYGMDADLIMLSLLATIKNEGLTIKLVRDTMILDVNALKRAIEETEHCSIPDYIVLCFLLGNDFLPNMAALNLRDNGIDLLMKSYRTVNKPLIVDNMIDWQTFGQILQELGKSEGQLIIDKTGEWLNRTVPRTSYGISKDNDKSKDTKYSFYYPLLTENKINHTLAQSLSCNGQKWRPLYYKHLFNTSYQDTHIIGQASSQYVRGINWIFKYYNESYNDDDWFYYWGYAPTIGDLANYVLTNKDTIKTEHEKGKREKGETEGKEEVLRQASITDVYVQLLAILPPTSIRSLNVPILTKAVNHPMIKHLYPSEYRIETYLKTALHECYPVLPPIDFDLLYKTLSVC